MFVGFARYDLRLPGCSSLKEKRSVMRTLQSRLHQRFHCAVAEVDANDMHQRGTIGVSIVSGSAFQARKVLAEIERHVASHPEVELIGGLEDVVAPGDS